VWKSVTSPRSDLRRLRIRPPAANSTSITPAAEAATAAAVAAIGTLPLPVMHRSIVIHMERRDGQRPLIRLDRDDADTKADFNTAYTTDLGEAGVDLGKLYDYDIILLDLNLPDMSGFEVLRSLRVSKVNTPILILSGLAGITDKVKGLGIGADDYMTKTRAGACARTSASGPAPP
jgi:CheY-like chemotaxis protein